LGARYKECRPFGYLQICGDNVEYRDEGEVVAHSLSLLQRCIEWNQCSRGIIVSGNPGKIKRASERLYLSLIPSAIEYGTGGSSLLLLNGLTLSNMLDFVKLNTRGYAYEYEIVAASNNFLVGIRRKNYILIPNTRLGYMVELSLEETGYPLVMPLLLIVGYSILKAYRRLVFSLETPPPSKSSCSKHADLLECYKYKGSSRCVFNKKIVCPLRFLYRKPPIDGIGGAFYHLENAERILNIISPYKNKGSRLDYYTTAFLVTYIKLLSIYSGLALKRIMGLKITAEEGSLLSKYERNLQVLSNSSSEVSLKMAAFLGNIANSTLGLNEKLNEPYQLRTYLMLAAENLPYLIKRLSTLSRHYSAYSICKPSYLSQKIVFSYIVRFFPLLGKEVASEVSEKISKGITEWGCIEAEDLQDILAPPLSKKLLNTLSEKNLLRKVPITNAYIYTLR
jgi:hypothetical protein